MESAAKWFWGTVIVGGLIFWLAPTTFSGKVAFVAVGAMLAFLAYAASSALTPPVQKQECSCDDPVEDEPDGDEGE